MTSLLIIEIIASALLILNVYLLAQEKLVNYWFGLAGVVLFGYIFWQVNLYSDMLLQWLFYAPLQLVGWYMWKYRFQEDSRLDSMKIVTIESSVTYYILLLLSAIAVLVLGSFMYFNTNADFAYYDAATTVMSIVASILMLRKYLENWYVWIAMDCVAIPLYFAKGLYVTSGLYTIFLGLAIYGLLTWNAKYWDNKACRQV